MNNTLVDNEAELQANLVGRVRAALPLLPANFKLERYLSLRLGHRALNLDGTMIERDVIHGRYDFLVLVEKPP